MSRKRRKSLPPADQYHARKMREIGMPVKECADYFDVSVATLMRGLAEIRERLGPENFVESRRQFARPSLRIRKGLKELTSNT